MKMAWNGAEMYENFSSFASPCMSCLGNNAYPVLIECVERIQGLRDSLLDLLVE